MKKHDNKKRQESRSKKTVGPVDSLQRAEDFARKALAALSQKPVSESKVKAVAKKISQKIGTRLG